MACILSKGIKLDCSPNTGGVEAIWLAPISSVWSAYTNEVNGSPSSGDGTVSNIVSFDYDYSQYYTIDYVGYQSTTATVNSTTGGFVRNISTVTVPGNQTSSFQSGRYLYFTYNVRNIDGVTITAMDWTGTVLVSTYDTINNVTLITPDFGGVSPIIGQSADPAPPNTNQRILTYILQIDLSATVDPEGIAAQIMTTWLSPNTNVRIEYTSLTGTVTQTTSNISTISYDSPSERITITLKSSLPNNVDLAINGKIWFARPFLQFEFLKSGASFEQPSSINLENGSTYYTHTLQFQVPKQDVYKRNKVYQLASGNGKFLAIIKDMNGKYWMSGLQSDGSMTLALQVTTSNAISGKAKSDMNGYDITLGAELNTLAFSISAIDAKSLIRVGTTTWL
jgi:hypothetical protein